MRFLLVPRDASLILAQAGGARNGWKTVAELIIDDGLPISRVVVYRDSAGAIPRIMVGMTGVPGTDPPTHTRTGISSDNGILGNWLRGRYQKPHSEKRTYRELGPKSRGHLL